MTGEKYIGWFGVFRLGLVQMALGSIVVLMTSTLNRIMVVELALPAVLPGALVAWHFAIQMSRPRWGYESDTGASRTQWIIGGMIALGIGAVGAAFATMLMETSFVAGAALSFLAFSLIGIGVGAAGTNLLALLAIRTAPERKAAAAAIVWIMMIFGFVVTAGIAGQFLDPFSMTRLVAVTGCAALIAVLIASIAVWNIEKAGMQARHPVGVAPTVKIPFRRALAEVWGEAQARRFAVFVFVSMLAYSAQDLILEPFAGIIHGYTPGESTSLASVQNGGVLVGMIVTAIIGTLVGKSRASFMRSWMVASCIASAASLAGLASGATAAAWPLQANVFLLGLSNGAFAVAAIGSMMTLANAGAKDREGTRMGVWGAAQAVAFGLGGLLGAAAVDVSRAFFADPGSAFALVFALEGGAFLVAAVLASRVGASDADHMKLPMMPAANI